MFVYMEPLVAVIVAAVLLGEPILATSLLGGAIILLGVWLALTGGMSLALAGDLVVAAESAVTSTEPRPGRGAPR